MLLLWVWVITSTPLTISNSAFTVPIRLTPPKTNKRIPAKKSIKVILEFFFF